MRRKCFFQMMILICSLSNTRMCFAMHSPASDVIMDSAHANNRFSGSSVDLATATDNFNAATAVAANTVNADDNKGGKLIPYRTANLLACAIMPSIVANATTLCMLIGNASPDKIFAVSMLGSIMAFIGANVMINSPLCKFKTSVPFSGFAELCCSILFVPMIHMMCNVVYAALSSFAAYSSNFENSVMLWIIVPHMSLMALFCIYACAKWYRCLPC